MTKKKERVLSIKFWTTKSMLDDILVLVIIICLFTLAYLFFFYESPQEICDHACYEQFDSRIQEIQIDVLDWCLCQDGNSIQATSAG